jgi:hypothetical protein
VQIEHTATAKLDDIPYPILSTLLKEDNISGA